MSSDTFINPYNFVPLKEAVDRKPVSATLDKYTGYTGKMTIILKTLTRLFIPDTDPNQVIPLQKGRPGTPKEFMRFLQNANNDKIIPGSSLKGMLRSVAEALSNSCFSLETAAEIYLGEHSKDLCSTYFNEAENRTDLRLCPCCRLFGRTAEGEDDEHDKNLKSRLCITDAILENSDKIDNTSLYLFELSSPKPHHAPFYFEDYQNENPSKIRGRKFYYHFYPNIENEQELAREKSSHRSSIIHQSILPDAFFRFNIYFENLEPEEMTLMIYSILLNRKSAEDENFMAHKIGMAKPLGFGSVHLSIESLTLHNGADAYNDLSSGFGVYMDAELEQKINDFIDILPNPFENSGGRYDVWKFPRTEILGSVRYPKKSRPSDPPEWFNIDKNADMKYPLPTNGELPDPWQEFVPDRADEYKQRSTSVKVIKRTRSEAYFKINNKTESIISFDKKIQEGSEILVWKNEKDQYILFKEDK